VFSALCARNSHNNCTRFRSTGNDELYVLIGGSEERLAQEADRIDYDLQLDPQACMKSGRDQNNRG
jgi:hypothetical protein